MSKLAMKGHATRGREVIEILEMLGGNNICKYNADCSNIYFYIGENSKNIYYNSITIFHDIDFIIFTLEEFLEKFPYKVGDKVSSKYLKNYKIEKMKWIDTDNKIVYKLQGNGWYNVDELEPYKEKTMEITEEFYNKHCVNCGSQRCTHNGEWLKECEHYKEETTNKAIFEGNAQSCDIMNNIIKEETMGERKYSDLRLPLDDDDKLATEVTIGGNKILPPNGYLIGKITQVDNGMIVEYVKKQPQYPKTYKECFNICFGNKHHIVQVVGLDDLGDNKELFESFIKLKICRDAYWKIASDWKPDVMYCNLYCIGYDGNVVTWKMQGGCRLLAFPTEEMRDAFYENFKDLIERCKELL